MRVSVFGLGYVGSVSAGCLVTLGHEVIGVDVNPTKVAMTNAGQSPVIEAGLNELFIEGVETGKLRATTVASEAIANSDVSLICVGTPSEDNGSLKLTYVERVCKEIGRALDKQDGYHVVVLRSTVLPGSTEQVVIPLLEKESGRQVGLDFGVAFNPEFLREGSAIHDFQHPPFTLIGEYNGQGAEVCAELYDGIDAPLLVVPLGVAETVKYANNAFHQVMDIFCMDEKLNLSSYYLKPGFAFGGSCLPKDLRALLYHAHHLDLSVPVLEAILPSNELQVKRGFEFIKRTGHKKIGVLGFSFKAGTDDLRESPLVALIETLIGKGYDVKVYDKNVSMARLHGANRAYIEREIPHIATLMCSSIEDILVHSEVIVIGNRAPEFASALHQLRPDQMVIDLVRIVHDIDQIDSQYDGICW
jgi:GDP-mannose 6-dehydrogenase